MTVTVNNRFTGKMFIDVVIPVALKDKEKLIISLSSFLSNCATPIRNVYLICSSSHFDVTQLTKVKLIPEEQFPFTLKDLEQTLKAKGSSYAHCTWYYQQLLKLYVFEVLNDLNDNVLILDSDFAIKRPITLLTDDGRAVLVKGYPFSWNVGENTDLKPKHSHIDFSTRLMPGWNLQDNFTGMHHHILLNKQIMRSLFAEVQQHHSLPFWMAFMECVDVQKWNAASEYILYYHYCLQNFPNKVVTRHLDTVDIIHDCDGDNVEEALTKWENMIETVDCDAVGCHGFIDLRKRLHTMDYLNSEFRKIVETRHAAGFMLQLMDGILKLYTL